MEIIILLFIIIHSINCVGCKKVFSFSKLLGSLLWDIPMDFHMLNKKGLSKNLGKVKGQLISTC